MYKIYIDSTDRYEKIVSLKKDDTEIDKRSGKIDIVSSIKDLLSENDIEIDQVEFVANPGPGSFTGIKMGLTISNVLNWITGKKKIEELQKPEYGAAPNIHKTKWIEQ